MLNFIHECTCTPAHHQYIQTQSLTPSAAQTNSVIIDKVVVVSSVRPPPVGPQLNVPFAEAVAAHETQPDVAVRTECLAPEAFGNDAARSCPHSGAAVCAETAILPKDGHVPAAEDMRPDFIVVSISLLALWSRLWQRTS